ncbi:stage VI sporulation protein F [Brevibacillus dissolubilis]|uniref:stage VI sporulation protein F n=1 Tax=Brevibacillus dissolubilis TaxID=1844116 RepID=UPI0011169E59|nr:stage VI sporulation protein F [Brevibacillus dissolubilis]
MFNKNTRGLFDKLKGKMGNLDEGQLRSLAGSVNKNDLLQDENKLRQIIKTLAGLSGKSLTADQENKIVEMFKNNEINPNDLSSLSKFLK